jgi:transposase
MDGAPYHKSEETTEFLRMNQVNAFISAPYSYNAAVCELWFSYLKNCDLNPNKNSTGKKYISILILILEDLFKI